MKIVTRSAAKRISAAILTAFLCLALVSCSSQPAVREDILTRHSGNYQTSANITCRDLKATATITQDTPKSCTVLFESPPSLKDMAFVFHEDAVDLSYKGLSFTFNPKSVPGRAIAEIAVSSINKAMKNDGISMDYTDEILTLSGTLESGEFSLRLDPAEGNLLKLSVPAEDLEIAFVNFTFLD